MFKFFFSCLFLSSALFGAQSSIPSLDEMMSIEDQKETGVVRLTDLQRKALAQWLIKHGYYDKNGNEDTLHGLTVSININSGKAIQLSDNSVYEIAPEDQTISAQWLGPIPIKVTNVSDPNYPFLLTNLHNHLSVKAKKGILR